MEVSMPGIPRIFSALAQWASCMIFVLPLGKRLRGWRMGMSAALMLISELLFMELTGPLQIEYWVPCMIIAGILMCVAIFIYTGGRWMNVIYGGLQSFIMAEFTASFGWLITCILQLNTIWFGRYLVLLIIYGVIYLFIHFMILSKQPPDEMPDVECLELVTTFIMTISIFTVSNLGFLPGFHFPGKEYGWSVAAIRTIIDFAGMAMMYANYVQRFAVHSKIEMKFLENVISNQYVQYKQSRESIDLINYKYHDLKHQLVLLRKETDDQKREEFIRQIEEDIHGYEMLNETGNRVVDTMLTSKMLICEKEHISMSCVANGEILNFMEKMDICSILGNALDNAIECEKKIPDHEKRLIHTAIFPQEQFAILRFENYFEGKLDVQEGMPKTTKTKKELHGYGIKSIQYTARKYGGEVSFSVRDNWFELKVLIPIPAGGRSRTKQ